MRSNIRQVATRAGVSPSTVSNVLLGRHGNVSPATRDQVLRAVQELEYVPVRPAFQNRAGKTRVLALTLADAAYIHYEFYARTYAGICETALKHNYDILTVLRQAPDWAVERSGISLLDRRSDGIIILSPNDYAGETLEALVRHNIPTVVCYRRDVPKGIGWVDPNNQQGITEAIAHLRENGHQKIIHLTSKVGERFDFRERRRFFLAAVECEDRDGAAPCVIDSDGEVTIDLVHRIQAMGTTAVICANDWLAVQLWKKLEEKGLKVPQDISLIGIDNSPLCEQYGLTSMGFSFEDVGSRAVEAVLSQIEGHPAQECCYEISLQLFKRNSVTHVTRSGCIII